MQLHALGERAPERRAAVRARIRRWPRMKPGSLATSAFDDHANSELNATRCLGRLRHGLTQGEGDRAQKRGARSIAGG